ncbi:unnamed protein product, partial [Mesorhabditis spiculigera]
MSENDIEANDGERASTSEERDIKPEKVDLDAAVAQFGESCRVCRAPSAALHYGAVTCGGCKIFFLRAVMSASAVLCEKDNQCRNLSKCRFCRFQRCIAAGMKPSMVGKKEGAMRRPPKVSDIPLAMLGGSAVPQLESRRLCAGASSFTTLFKKLKISKDEISGLIELERFCDPDEPSTSTVSGDGLRYDMEVSVGEGFQDPLKICDRTPMMYGAEKPLVTSGFSEQLRSSYCRSFVHFLDWARGSPEVWKLDEGDRTLHLCATGASVVLFSSAYNSYRLGVDGLAFNHGMRIHGRHKANNLYTSFCNTLADYMDSNIVSIFKKAAITEEEYVIIKKILFFTSPPSLSDSGQEAVRKSKRKWESVLVKHLSDQYKEKTTDFQTERLSVLMNLVPLCMKIAQISDRVFAKMVVYNVKNIRGRLSLDMHVRGF